MLVFAVIFISLACVTYTIGVWAEKFQNNLKLWHVLVFWLGLAFDTTGTSFMEKIAGGGFQISFHAVTGLSAVLLMLFHAIWATTVIAKNNEKWKHNFHKFSIVVWVIWLIPMASGMIQHL
jgi:uncharacterized repeat protein (TIGR03987 family)